MYAELVIDLDDVGRAVGDALERNEPVLPSLGQIAALWRGLGIEVTAMHIVRPGYSLRQSPIPSAEEAAASAWWETEAVFLTDETFEVSMLNSAVGDEGPVAHESLVITTALHRSDELAEATENHDNPASVVIVMSDTASSLAAVTHARGVPVMVAGTQPPTADISHTQLDDEWMAGLASRFADTPFDDVVLLDGQPWRSGQPLGTPFTSMLGRDSTVAVLPPAAESVVLFDPEYFYVVDGDDDATPNPRGVASVVRTLGLGEHVHVETSDGHVDDHAAEIALIAALYRFSADHPDMSIIIASGRPGLVVATSDLDTFALQTSRRFLRLCLPFRRSTFDEGAFSGRETAPRVLLERSLSEPLFAEDDESIMAPPIEAREDERSSSPALVLFSNPRDAREISSDWRSSTGRRFLTLGADVLVAHPADQPGATPLPVSLGGCTDFSIRRPDLEPGEVVEGILDTTRQRWIVVSDPIERRAEARAADASGDDRQTNTSSTPVVTSYDDIVDAA